MTGGSMPAFEPADDEVMADLTGGTPPNVYGLRVLPDGRIASVDPLTFGRARLYVTRPENWGYTYDDGW